MNTNLELLCLSLIPLGILTIDADTAGSQSFPYGSRVCWLPSINLRARGLSKLFPQLLLETGSEECPWWCERTHQCHYTFLFEETAEGQTWHVLVTLSQLLAYTLLSVLFRQRAESPKCQARLACIRNTLSPTGNRKNKSR